MVLAECGHFVVTWSVQEYSCGHLACAGIFMWSLGLCRSTPAQSCVHPGLCRNMPAEPEPFDLCACSCMNYLVGSLICARIRIFHSECPRELAMASSEPSTSRLPKEDSSDMDSDSDNEVS